MEDNLRSFISTFLIVGLFAFSVLNFVVLFPTYQGRGDILENETTLNVTRNNLQGDLDDANTGSNETVSLWSSFDPETSDNGDKSTVALGYNSYENVSGIKDTLKIFFSTLFGDAAPTILVTLGTMFAVSAAYFGIKFARQGY